MAIMVTGGSGLIGARIVRILAGQGHDVVAFDLAPPRATGSSNEERVAPSEATSRGWPI